MKKKRKKVVGVNELNKCAHALEQITYIIEDNFDMNDKRVKRAYNTIKSFEGAVIKECIAHDMGLNEMTTGVSMAGALGARDAGKEQISDNDINLLQQLTGGKSRGLFRNPVKKLERTYGDLLNKLNTKFKSAISNINK